MHDANMPSTERHMRQLARAAGAGDATAMAELRREIEVPMVWIVKHTLESDESQSPLDGQIRTLAQQLADPYCPDSDEDKERLVARVAATLCDEIMDKVRARGRVVSLQDTLTY